MAVCQARPGWVDAGDPTKKAIWRVSERALSRAVVGTEPFSQDTGDSTIRGGHLKGALCTPHVPV